MTTSGTVEREKVRVDDADVVAVVLLAAAGAGVAVFLGAALVMTS